MKPLLLAQCLLKSYLPASGAVFSRPDAWYTALRKPAGNPPPQVFGPVWTLLYTLMGVSLYLCRTAPGADSEAGRRAQRLFDLQLTLNAIWSPVFFGVRSPKLALGTLLLLWACIGATIRAFDRVSRPAALLLAPYLLWVTFAAYLNAGICILNPEEG